MSDIVEIPEFVSLDQRTRAIAYLELTKPRIAVLVLVVSAVGFLLALPAEADFSAAFLFVHALVGTALVSGGANALNQYLEADYDRLMIRTEHRPIPSGRLTEDEALRFGVAAAVLGVLDLVIFVNTRASLVAAATVGIYVFVYTPLKRKSWSSVFVGAVAGAMPPVIGWTAGGGTLGLEASLLFSIAFFWQLPHFAAIAWLYRDDYGAAGYPVLPVVDPEGTRTDLHMMTHSVGLLVASLLPAIYGFAGPAYLVGAMVLGTAFLIVGVYFMVRKTRRRARVHLFSSVAYLPTLMLLMTLDRVFWS